MQIYKGVLVIIPYFLFAVCFDELNIERKDKFLNGFIEYLNNLPDQIYIYDEGVLLSAHKTDDGSGCYYIEARLRANDIHNVESYRYLKCSATIQDLEENGVAVQDNLYRCEDVEKVTQANVADSDTKEDALLIEHTTTAGIHQPVHLDNEVQSNTGVTSGEEFIAVPRRQYGGTCIGCSTHVNPQAPGVSDLAALGIRHLDSHQPLTKHFLQSVFDVERQVQVVNGVRYILILQVGFDNCTSTPSEPCFDSKVCRIAILEKSWIKLADGSKYRAILSNNCTEEWIFGDEGEYIPNSESNDININPAIHIQEKENDPPIPVPDYNKLATTGSPDEIIKPIHNTDIQTKIQTEKSLTEKELKDLEEQVISQDNIHHAPSGSLQTLPTRAEGTNVKLSHFSDSQSQKQNNGHTIQYKQPKHEETVGFLNEDRKKAIDDLMNLFNSAGFDTIHDNFSRVKRSYEHELKVMAVAEKIHKIKKNINSAKYIYSLAQNMVDYINEMDLEVKTRVLLDVIAAEEEFENSQNFFYIQARVVIPCDKANCEENDISNKICNGVIETTDQERPQILSAFCHDEQKKKLQLGKMDMVELNDPVLLKLTKDSLMKIELESKYPNAMKIEKILQAYTRRASGTITKIIVSITYTDCNKTVPYVKRTNCTVLQSMDSNVCEITVHERHWLKEKKITYTCAQRPIDERFSNIKEIYKVDGTIKDKKIMDLAQEALQYLEMKSNKINKQKIVQINSVTTQLIAGLLTEIIFSVGYTTCSNDLEVDLKSCEILKNEPLRECKARVWDRPWLEDGRKMNVDCVDSSKMDSLISRQKRSANLKFVGGQKTVNPNNYESLANESLQHYLQSNEVNEYYEVLKVINVTVQIVAGTKTRIAFIIAPKNCKDKEIHCRSTIWDRPWLNIKEINTTCDNINVKSVQKRHALGGELEQDPKEPLYKQMALDSLKKFLQDSKITQHHEVVNIKKVTEQVVSGIITKIDFTVSPTNCELDNNMVPTTSDCALLNSSNIISCRSKIWEQKWSHKKEIEVSCDTNVENQRKKRQILGGSYLGTGNDSKVRKSSLKGKKVEQDPNLEEYKLLAQDSLRKYKLSQINKSSNHEVTKVEKVLKQVISGVKYYIDFVAKPECKASKQKIPVAQCNHSEDETLYCHSIIWKRPWRGSDEIDVDCNQDVSDEDDENNRKKRSVNLGALKTTGDGKDASSYKYRNKRQVEPVEDYIDEDIKYYYADRAIQHINDKTDSNNIQKLVTIHATQNVMNMGVNTIRMFIETAYTYCIRHQEDVELAHCEELSGMYHRLCYVRLWPSPDDELVIQSMAVVCDDEPDFKSITGISKLDLIKAALKDIEESPKMKYKVIHQGEPNLIPTLDSRIPFVLSFVAVTTNCSKYIDIEENPYSCYVDTNRVPRSCSSSIWIVPNSKKIKKIKTICRVDKPYRSKRSISLDSTNVTTDEKSIQNFVKESLEKLEMASLHKYKQRVLQINSFDTKIVKGRVTTIDFDVGYTTCLKYEWVDNITHCEFIEHLPRRHCISQIRERLWLNNGKKIDVNCEDDETPLEATIEFESAENAMQLAREALKHIEAKYPHPRKQKVVRIFSLDKQEIAGIHYRMKMEIGYTDCLALSIKDECNLVNNIGLNKFCRANIWLRPWTDHPPAYRVSCDYQDGVTTELYHKIQSEHLFSDFLTTYKPDYINDHAEMFKRYEIFQINVKKIHEFNTKERGTARYAVTRFSDLTYEEFGQRYLGLKPNLRDNNQIPIRKADIPQVHLPDKFDWRQYDAVTEVKDQGSCGSCWAFSVTGNIEGQWKMQSGELVSLSEQELVDCDKLDQGCDGGLPDNAYRAIEQLGGLEAENDYPYEGENDKCGFNKTLSRVQISGAVNISSNETDMAKWLVQNGPISIGINANAMQFYVGGVSHPWRMLCSPSNLDHGVLIVGYGIKDYPLFHKRLPYWIVKNSWGKRWGEQGYYRVYRGDGTCGVNQMASSAVI